MRRGCVSRRLIFVVSSWCLLVLSGTACQVDSSGPVSPSIGSGATGPATSQSPYGGNALRLIEEPASDPAGGSGIVNVVLTGTPGVNNFELTINVHGAPPDTDLYFQIRGDTNPLTRGDGVCLPGFPNPPIHAGGDAGILHTSPGGSGATHIKIPLPEVPGGPFEPGVDSDFKYRLVSLDQTFDLRTACIVFTGK